MMDFSLLVAALVRVSRYSLLKVVSRTITSGMCLGILSMDLSD